MTKDEALKLALEALEIQAYNSGDEKYTQAITAIKQALAAPVQEPVAWMYEDMMGLVGVRVQKEKPIVARPVTPLYTTPPAQPAPVQEPVGGATVYVHQSDDKGDVLGERWKAAHVKFKDGFLDQFAQGAKFDLYTTPPAAQPAPVQEQLGAVCADGGTCHHKCTERCFRRECCAPFSDYVGPWSYTTPPAAQRKHVTDGNPCWCEPETSYTDPETGASVIVHKEPQ